MARNFKEDISKCICESVEDQAVGKIKHRGYTADIFKDNKGFYAIVSDEDGETVYDNEDDEMFNQDNGYYALGVNPEDCDDLRRFKSKNACIEAAKNLIDKDNRSLGEYEIANYGSTSRLYGYDDIDEEKYDELNDNGETYELEDILKKKVTEASDVEIDLDNIEIELPGVEKSFSVDDDSIIVTYADANVKDKDKLVQDVISHFDGAGLEIIDIISDDGEGKEIVVTAKIAKNDDAIEFLKKDGFVCLNCECNNQEISEAVDNDKLMKDIAKVLCDKLGIEKFDSMDLSKDTSEKNVRTRCYEFEVKDFDKPNDDLPLDNELANAISLKVEGITDSDVDTFRCDENDHYSDEGKIFQVFVTVNLDASQLEGVKKNEIFDNDEIYNLEYISGSTNIEVSIVKSINADRCPLDDVDDVATKCRDFENEITDAIASDLDMTGNVESFINFTNGRFVVNIDFRDLSFSEVEFLKAYFELNGFTEGKTATFGDGN